MIYEDVSNTQRVFDQLLGTWSLNYKLSDYPINPLLRNDPSLLIQEGGTVVTFKLIDKNIIKMQHDIYDENSRLETLIPFLYKLNVDKVIACNANDIEIMPLTYDDHLPWKNAGIMTLYKDWITEDQKILMFANTKRKDLKNHFTEEKKLTSERNGIIDVQYAQMYFADNKDFHFNYHLKRDSREILNVDLKFKKIDL